MGLCGSDGLDKMKAFLNVFAFDGLFHTFFFVTAPGYSKLLQHVDEDLQSCVQALHMTNKQYDIYT